MSGAQPLRGPLEGLRVLELADEKGQFCGKLLGDLGADVIKIEPPGGEACASAMFCRQQASSRRPAMWPFAGWIRPGSQAN